MDTPFVSVVVPLFTHAKRVGQCLRELSKQTYPLDRFEVIVVDNSARTGGPAADISGPNVRVVAEARPGSYGARNRGVASAKGSIIAFTDADCLPATDWIERGVARLVGPPRLGLVGGRIDISCADPERPTPVELYEATCAFRQREYIDRWQFVATANAFTFRDVFDQVNGFDPHLFALGDRDWGRRVATTGYALGYADDARVVHPSRRTFGELATRTSRLAGGFFHLAVHRRSSLSDLAADVWIGLAPRRRLFGRAPSAWGRSLARRERVLVATTCAFVVVVRAAEMLRLALGGRPVRS